MADTCYCTHLTALQLSQYSATAVPAHYSYVHCYSSTLQQSLQHITVVDCVQSQSNAGHESLSELHHDW